MVRKLMLVAVCGAILWPCLLQRVQAQALRVGDVAPDFEIPDDQGKAWKSTDHVGRQVIVVYFYPSDFSFCCTRQAGCYREVQPDLERLNAQVVGISCDSVEAHQLFKATHALKYPLLSDRDGGAARKFGVPLRASGKAMAQDAAGRTITDEHGDPLQFDRDWTAARWTFVIGLDGRIAHRDTSVSPKSDGKTIAEIICNLTAN